MVPLAGEIGLGFGEAEREIGQLQNDSEVFLKEVIASDNFKKELLACRKSLGFDAAEINDIKWRLVGLVFDRSGVCQCAHPLVEIAADGRRLLFALGVGRRGGLGLYPLEDCKDAIQAGSLKTRKVMISWGIGLSSGKNYWLVNPSSSPKTKEKGGVRALEGDGYLTLGWGGDFGTSSNFVLLFSDNDSILVEGNDFVGNACQQVKGLMRKTKSVLETDIVGNDERVLCWRLLSLGLKNSLKRGGKPMALSSEGRRAKVNGYF